MKFKEVTWLRRRGPVNPAPDEGVEGTLLVGEKVIAEWSENHSAAGHDRVVVEPAYHNGEKAWLVSWIRCAARGYAAEGTREEILPFGEGVELLLKHGAYERMFE